MEFLAGKSEWTDRQYVNAAGGGSLALARKGGAGGIGARESLHGEDRCGEREHEEVAGRDSAKRRVQARGDNRARGGGGRELREGEDGTADSAEVQGLQDSRAGGRSKLRKRRDRVLDNEKDKRGAGQPP